MNSHGSQSTDTAPRTVVSSREKVNNHDTTRDINGARPKEFIMLIKATCKVVAVLVGRRSGNDLLSAGWNQQQQLQPKQKHESIIMIKQRILIFWGKNDFAAPRVRTPQVAPNARNMIGYGVSFSKKRTQERTRPNKTPYFFS